MRYLICIGFFLSLIYNGSAQNRSDQWSISLRTGDLLFCSSGPGELSAAIDRATQTENKTHFDHIGIVEICNHTVWVLHAAPQKGVCREVIGHFLSKDKEKIIATVYRLKSKYLNSIPEAIKKAHVLLGQPYNHTFILKDKGYYCSEYIYLIFVADSIFSLNPMTFKDPQTGQFLTGWVDHYQKLGVKIPEGEPGCNPNGMAASEKLEVIGKVKFKGKD